MGFGALIIGDEIIRGKRQDRHMAQVIRVLAVRGLDLGWCEFIGDDADLITRTLRRTFAGDDIVFCFGGIGATPDDLTRQCAAAAAGAEIRRHPEAVALLVEKFGDAAYPSRILMADFPAGSDIVPNSYNRIPGFSLGRHYFLPGFPEMAWPMMEWVLDEKYAHLHRPGTTVDLGIIVVGALESQLLNLMNEIVASYPRLKLFSLPSLGGPERRIELGVRGDPQQAAAAMARIRQSVTDLGFRWEERGVI